MWLKNRKYMNAWLLRWHSKDMGVTVKGCMLRPICGGLQKVGANHCWDNRIGLLVCTKTLFRQPRNSINNAAAKLL